MTLLYRGFIESVLAFCVIVCFETENVPDKNRFGSLDRLLVSFIPVALYMLNSN